MMSSCIKKTEIITHKNCTVNLNIAGKLLMSSSKEIRKRKKIDSKKTIHFVLMVFSIRKYNEIDITIAGIRIMPPPLGIDCL